MVEEDRSKDNQQDSKESAFAVGSKPAERTPSLSAEKPVQAVGTQDNESGRDLSRQPGGQQPTSTDKDSTQELKTFERITVRIGIATAGVALITSVLFLIQIKVTSHQNQILSSQAINGVAQSIIQERNTAKQLELLRQQTQAAQSGVDAISRQMREDQRPWIRITSDEIMLVANQPVTSTIYLTNTGKTPALEIIVVFMLDKIDGGHSPDFLKRLQPHEKKFAFKLRVTSQLRVGSIVPNQDPKQNSLFVGWGEAGDVGKQANMKAISETEYVALAKTNSYFALHGWATYKDGFGIYHWTQFCAWKAVILPHEVGIKYSTAGRCSEYNQSDSNY